MEQNKICELGRMVIETEAQVINALSNRIDATFAKACDYLYKCPTRIVVMGVGKSGHISRKIAATLASTGSPAFFIHPSEAKHGDMGMITKSDVLLILSYSGETEEINVLLPFIKRLECSLIALTSQPHSTLAKAASIVLDISVEKEACPLGLAPTSSTTAMLVMGDALAMTLLARRGFTKEDFAISHPGGSLGRRLLLRVDEIMHQGDALPRVSKTATLKTALIVMTQKKLGMTTIIDENEKLIGIFTDGDVRRALDNHVDIHQTAIEKIMTKNPRIIAPHTLASVALAKMEDHKITALVVTNTQQQPIGVIHIHDILRAGV